ncbi:MAG TPA: hypothetical protein VN792_01400 [Candidatus Acidoferrales bacterium]|nr:hypothetical protein [Candidatus Acidoferrales bacterium]
MQKNRTTRSVGAALAACTIVASGLFYLSFAHGKTAIASPAPDLLSALPAGAPTLVYLDFAALRASSFYQHRPDKGPIAVPNQDYADFMRSTGFDFEKDLDRAVVASWPAPSGKELAKNVVIAEGRFDRAKIRDYAAQKGKLDHQQGREVFLFPAKDRMVMSSLTFLDDHRIALVTGPSIAPIFAANSNDPAAADPARERAARLDGAAVFAITRVPPVPDNTGAGGVQGAGAAQLLSMARSVQWITLAARPEGEDLRISLEGECDNSTDALQLKSALELLRMFGRAGLESPKTRQSMDPAALAMLETLLSSADVTQAAERVRILIEITPDVWHLSGPAKPQH